jgi:hypothetical protein
MVEEEGMVLAVVMAAAVSITAAAAAASAAAEGAETEGVVGGRGRLQWLVVVKVSDFLKQQKAAAPAGGDVVLSRFREGLGQKTHSMR